jgi:hypothetical protein
MDSEQLLEMIKDLLTERLGPVMDRLERLEAMADKAEEKEEVVERIDSEARDDERDERKEEGETTEAAELMPAGEEGEEAIEAEAVDGEEDKELEEDKEDASEMKMDYAKLMEDYKKLEEELKSLKKESTMKEAAIANLKQEAVLKEARHQVAVNLQDKPHLSSMSERLVDLYVNDQDLYNEILSIKGGAMSSLSERTSRGLAPVVSSAKKDIYEQAFEIQNAEGISYADALAKLTK